MRFVRLMLTTAYIAQAQPKPAPPEDSVKTFLRAYVKNLVSEDKTTRYLHKLADLNGDGEKEAIVYLMGRDWCGSGGCNTLILRRDGASWKVVSKITITHPPIRVLSGTSHGWHSISVWVQGGGIQPGYEAELRFDGRIYPENPSVPPARRLSPKVAGETVILSSDGGAPLYP